MRNRVALIIPYFGKKPPYFDLWYQSARYNSDFDFLFFSDIDLGLPQKGNVRQYWIGFSELKNIISKKIPIKGMKLNRAYKICDYKPTYGLVFEKYLSGYDFWGFADVDVILGDLSKFVTDELLDGYDKLYYEGHFSLFRNNEKMRRLFLEIYPHVLNYKIAFSTNYSCHFDENGTVVWAHEVDPGCGVRFYAGGSFFDVPYNRYELTLGQTKGYAVWEDGKLYFKSFDGKVIKELMYIHLQKRKMKTINIKADEPFAIARTQFYKIGEKEYLQPDSCRENELRFINVAQKNRIKDQMTNIKNGALWMRILRKVYKWKAR